MIESNLQAIENIYQAVQNKDFHAKVEPNDVKLTNKESEQIVKRYWQYKSTQRARLYNHCARYLANKLSAFFNHHTEYVGLENWKNISGGSILTSNHFSPLENTAVREAVRKTDHKHLYIVSQETNLFASQPLKFLFWNYDILPITSQSTDFNYMGRVFPRHVKSALDQGDIVMIYPEQEMWYNYRKPRPVKRGAYYYAARFNVPVRSCFIEIIDDGIPASANFNKTHYRVHVLKTIYPDPHLSVRENSKLMAQQDYQQKVAAYEQAYRKPLTYRWESGDIAGLRKEDEIVNASRPEIIFNQEQKA